jgi:glycosyltransferase involved in cell wall biosynthesis
MKILIITGSFPPMKCGVGDYSHCLANALLNQPEGHHISIITSSNAKSENTIDEKIEIFPLLNNWNIIETSKIIKLVRILLPDIIHIQYPTQGYGNGYLPRLLPIILFLMRKKVIQTWHEGYSRRYIPWLLLKLLVSDGLVFVRLRYLEEKIHPLLNNIVRKKNPVFIPNASSIPKVSLNQKERIDLKNSFIKEQSRLVVFFGFIYPAKGLELLFEIADPQFDQIVIVGEPVENDEYYDTIKKLSSDTEWKGKVDMLGFMSPRGISKLLTVADAILLPFRAGGGEWNTTIHAAISSGSFVITTSSLKNGYDKKKNVFFAKIDDVQEMKFALNNYAGKQRDYNPEIDTDKWSEIAKQHILLYKNVLEKNSTDKK